MMDEFERRCHFESTSWVRRLAEGRYVLSNSRDRLFIRCTKLDTGRILRVGNYEKGVVLAIHPESGAFLHVYNLSRTISPHLCDFRFRGKSDLIGFIAVKVDW